MGYTLMKGLVWFLLALALGVTIGWLLRSVVAGRQISKARSGQGDSEELERLRTRVSELEAVVVDQAAKAERAANAASDADAVDPDPSGNDPAPAES